MTGSFSRFNYEWDWNPKLFINADTSQTIKYSTVAAVTNGTYWSDVIEDVHQTKIKDNYTWSTAFLFVKDIFDVSVTDDEGNELPVALQVWVGDQSGLINSWPNP
jgi:hypothetical protein